MRSIGGNRTSRRWVFVLISVASVLSFYVLWYLMTEDGFGVIRPLMFPSPSMVVDSLLTLSPETVFRHVYMTTYRMLVGWSLGVALGICVGLAMSYSRVLRSILDPLIESFRPVPVIALLPFFILWFGIDEVGKIVMILLGTFMIMVVNTYEAVINVNPIYIRAAESLGADKLSIYRTIVVPAILPSLAAGLRISSALSFTLVVASEFMGAQSGLGYMIMSARRTLSTETILLGCLIFGIVSTVIDFAIRKAINYLTRWSERVP